MNKPLYVYVVLETISWDGENQVVDVYLQKEAAEAFVEQDSNGVYDIVEKQLK